MKKAKEAKAPRPRGIWAIGARPGDTTPTEAPAKPGLLIPVKNTKGAEVWINPAQVVRAVPAEGHLELWFTDGHVLRIVDFTVADLDK